jgi:hypothetical protein
MIFFGGWNFLVQFRISDHLFCPTGFWYIGIHLSRKGCFNPFLFDDWKKFYLGKK